jgi:hypothetical protein
MPQHHRFEARTTDLVHRGTADRYGDARFERSLARRRLAKPGRQDATHNYFADICTCDICVVNGRPDRGRAKINAAEGAKLPLERSDGRPHGANEYNFSHYGFLGFSD